MSRILARLYGPTGCFEKEVVLDVPQREIHIPIREPIRIERIAAESVRMRVAIYERDGADYDVDYGRYVIPCYRYSYTGERQ